MRQTLAITRKELNSYFGSPMALIFIGVFLAAALFTFFWIDTFFARGIADVRPLFRWMPILLLISRRRAHHAPMERGSPIRHARDPADFARRSLAACHRQIPGRAWRWSHWRSVSPSSLPVTVAILGNLDWGPVIGGYLAALLLASAYAAIGLFISSRTDNEIVALILSVAGGRRALSARHERRHRVRR